MRHAPMWFSLLLALTQGCFGSPPDLATGQLELRSLRVLDAAGARYATAAIPRRPRLELELVGEGGHDPGRVTLILGEPDPELLDDVFDPPLRQSTEARLVPLDVQAGSSLSACPTQALTQGALYTLLVLLGPEEVDATPLWVSPSPAAGAELVASWPADGAQRVPPNLAHALLRWDGTLLADDLEAVLLKQGERVLAVKRRLEPCAATGWPAGSCLTLTPKSPLAPERQHTIVLPKLRDVTGAELPATRIAFRTAKRADHAADLAAPLPCDEGELPHAQLCLRSSDQSVRVRLRTEETLHAELRTPARSVSSLTTHGEATLLFSGLSPDSETPAALHLHDLAGNAWSMPLSLRTRPAMARLRIEEVLANPRGPERSQERVELLSYDSHPMSLLGFSIVAPESGARFTIVSAPTLGAGERVVVIGPAHDPDDLRDMALSDAAQIARTDRALSIPNEGARLELRDASDRVLSRAALPLTLPEGTSAVRVRGATRRDDEAFTEHPAPGSSLGEATRWP